MLPLHIQVSGTGSKDVKSSLALLDRPFDSGWDTKPTTTLPPPDKAEMKYVSEPYGTTDTV